VGVAGYGVYNGGTSPLATTTATSYTFTGLGCGTSYALSVDAFDAAGNRSGKATVTASTSPCPPDTSPPTAPTNLKVSSPTSSSLPLSWTASTDNVAVTGYDVYLNGTKLTTTTNTSYTFTGLTCATSYTLALDAYDATGNTSAPSTVQASTGACPDTTPPTVSITNPIGGAVVSGTASVQATATDDTGVVGVQFKLDGANLGAEVVLPPYLVAWDTTAVANGTHTLTAVARDAAGNTTTAANVVVTVTNAAPASPTPVPPANTYGVTVGPGFVDASTREVVRTAGGIVYVVTADDDTCQGSASGKGVIRVWKGTGAQAGNSAVPTGFAEQDAADHPSSAGSGDCTYSGSSILGSPDVRLDSSGVIHMAYIDGYDGTVYYQTFSTVTDTWGGRTVIGSGGQTTSGSSWPREGQVALTLDANDVPNVVYATSGASNQLKYTIRAGGVWTTPLVVASGSNLMHPSMVTSLDGTLHLVWLANSLATHATIGYAHYAVGAWSAPETVSSGDSIVLANGDDDQGPSVATDASNTPYVLYMDGTVSGADDYVRMRYRAGDGTWTDDTPPGGNGGASNPAGTLFAHTPQDYISSRNAPFVFLGHDVNIEFGYQYQVGGVGTSWAPYTTLDPRSSSSPAPGDTVEPGTDGSASVRFDPLRDNNAGIIDVIYYDERDNADATHHHATVYYKAIVIGSG
jgi:chitodextrinase